MAITVTDNRTTVDEFDVATNLSSPVGGEALNQFTSDPDPKELTAHYGMAISTEEGEIVATISAVDLSAGVLIYVWVLPLGTMDTVANYGVSMVIGDGTNTNAYQLAGAAKSVFRHPTGQPSYQCLLLDTGALPSGKALRGTFANLSLTAVTEFGANYVTLSKALGGSSNCFTDIIRYGNGGLTITATDSASGFLADLAALDSSNTSLQAYGVCRDLGGGIYGIQAKILLGDTGTGSDTLSMTDQIFKIENFGAVGTDKFGITIQGNATGTQTITFSGSILFCPVGTGAYLTATDTNVESFDMTGCNITNFDQGVNLSADATNAPNHDISDNKFVGCSQVNSGKTAFKDNTIDSTTDANGGWIIDANTSMTNVSGLKFISDGTGHAIYITQTGTYTFTNFTYVGYGATTTTDAVIYNNSGGAVTINVSGGDTPTYRNGTSATTNIVSSKTLTINEVTAGANERLGVYLSDGAGSISASKTQFTSHATNNLASDTTFDITVTIPADTPASGTLKILQMKADGSVAREDSHSYTSFSGVTFSGLSPALAVTYDSSDKAFVPYIEKEVTTSPETYDYNYVSDRNIVTVWRKKGFKQFKIAGVLGATGYTTGVVKTPDPTVNLP